MGPISRRVRKLECISLSAVRPAGYAVAVLFRSLVIPLVALGAFAADAKALDWLYDVDVPVASQAGDERRRAARGALAEVLTRVAGMATLPSNDEIDAALRQPERFYTRYEYASRTTATRSTGGASNAAPDADDDPERSSGTAAPIAEPAMLLSFHFEPGSVQALLRRANLPVWAANRPTVLAWVAIEQGDDRQLVAAAVEKDIAAALAERGRRRGLALSLPLMDLQDMEIAPADVWGRFWERINAASTRYASDLLLLGSVRQVRPGLWQAEWDLRTRHVVPTALRYDTLAEKTETAMLRAPVTLAGHFRHQAKSAAEAVRLALDGVADQLADRFAGRGDAAAIAVTVTGAHTVRGYAALMKYLRSREFIERIYLDRIAADGATLRLQSRSSRDQLFDLLSLEGLLTVADASVSTAHLAWQGDQ